MNYEAGKQFAWFVPPNEQHPKGMFHRSGKPMLNDEMMQAAAKHHWNHACYESVFQFPDWTGGRLTADIAKSAIIDRVFIDLDDKENPIRAIRDAGKIVEYLPGNTVNNFSGMKGAHVMIHCEPVDLIPDLKGSVLTRFAVALGERLDITTMDIGVTGDCNRVHRIIDSKHPGSGLFAIGLSAVELSELSMEEISFMAQTPRGLIQRPIPQVMLQARLLEIESAILCKRLDKLIDEGMIGVRNEYDLKQNLYEHESKLAVYEFILKLEEEVRRIQMKKLANMPATAGGRTPEETWLLNVVEIFKTTHRAANIQPVGSKVSTSSSEHEARCHIVFLADRCGWTSSEIVDIFSVADDFNKKITEGQVKSLLRR